MASSRDSASPSQAASADATVISGQPPVGPLSMAEIGRVLEGRRLGAYQLEQFVGGGGMGAVFRALDTTLDRVVAVKVLSRQQSADEEMLRRFRNEAQSAARLDHENIGRVHAVGSEDGWHFIVFEYIEGTNLRDVVREDGPFGVGRTLNVAIQIADALEHAADRDVVHRDIKPSNIIITPAGRARLVDMGLARLHHVEAEEDLTTSGMTLGTFDYISPEQARDPRLADVRSDLYSLGCTIFFTLVGRPPFADGTMVQKLLLHQQEPPPAVDALRPDVPRRFSAAIARLMAKDPADRYQRPADLIAELLGIAEDEGIDVSASRSSTVAAAEPPAEAERASASALPWLLPVAGLAAIVGGLWWMSPTAQRPAPEQRPAADVAPADALGGVEPPRDAAPWRVVDVPTGAREATSLADAVGLAASGDTIELAYDGTRDEPALRLEGRGLVVRAAGGYAPAVRFSGLVSDGGIDEQPSAAWTITSGTLTLERVRMVLVASPFAADEALVALEGGAALVCNDADLEIRGSDEGESPVAAALVRVADAGERGSAACQVRVARTVAQGAGDVLRVAGEQRVDVGWSGGRCVVSGAFLVAEGGALESAAGPIVGLALADTVFACREGFVRLIDSPARPALPFVRVSADACRFVVPEGAALLEQAGIEEPDRYRSAVEWLDGGSHYQGSSVFRRIDGAAERVEIDYASSGQALVHTMKIDADLEASWSDEPDS
jgi:hypothetical protein